MSRAAETLRIGDVLEEFKETFGASTDDVPVLTLTEHNGFVPQEERFNKRLATTDVSKYKVIRREDFAFNPYLLWAGALAQNDRFDVGVISPLYPTFRVRDGFDSSYFRHILLSPAMVQKYDTIAFGSVPRRRRSSVKDFLNLQLPAVPSLPEQRRIAATLDKAEEVKKTQEAAAALQTQLTESLARELLENATESLPLKALLERIDSGKSPVCEDRPAEEGEWAVLKLGAISSGTYLPTENKAIKPGTDPSPAHEVRPGDLLFSRKNTPELVGRTALVSETPPAMMMPDLIFRLVPKDGAPVTPEYLHVALNSPKVHNRLVGISGGSAASMVNISKSRLMNFEIPVPSYSAQQEFSKQFRAIANIANKRATARLEAIQIGRTLQSRAFRGKL